MIEPLHILKIFIYVLLDLIPCLILALIPFQNCFRFSVLKTYLFIFLLFLMVFISRILTLQGLQIARLLTYLWVGLYLVLYIVCIRVRVSILFFILLTILNYGSFKAITVNGIANCLPVCYTGRYSFFSSIIQLFVYAFTFPFLYKMMMQKVKPLVEKTGSSKYWRFLWLVPATFCLSYYYNLHVNGGTMAFSSKNNNIFFAIFFNLGGLFVTFLILQLLEECNDKLLLEQENHYLTMQSVQYENLKYRIEEARIAKHDLRQHLSVMQSCLQSKDYDRLAGYIHEYICTLPLDSPITYCEDYPLNALIVYYENMARERHIRFTADINYPADNKIPSSDAVILFGNLLENALEACARECNSESFISIRIKPMHNMIVAAVDNSCSAALPHYNKGYPSSKAPRMGIGTISIRKIAEKYSGTAQFKQENGVFYSSVLLYP